MEKLRSVIAAVGSKEEGEGTGDGLDVYMRDSQVKEAETGLRQLLTEVETKTLALRRLNKLMKVAAPALSSLHTNTQEKQKISQAVDTPAETALGNDVKSGSKTVRVDVQLEKSSDDVDSVDMSKTSTKSGDQRIQKNLIDSTSCHNRTELEPDDGFMSRSAFQSKGATISGSSDRSAGSHATVKRKREGEGEGEGEGDNCGNSPTRDRKNDNHTLAVLEKKTGERDGTTVAASVGSRQKKRATSGPSLCPSSQVSAGAGRTATTSSPPSPSQVSHQASPEGQSNSQHAITKSKKRGEQGKEAVATTAARAQDPDRSWSSSTLEGGDAVWCPPKNQTGDGKTSLNAKYGY